MAGHPANLHVLIPAPESNATLCKTLLSAAILGYPTPVIINWGRRFDDQNLADGGRHLAKILGIRDYLSQLDESHNEDIVLLLDSHDVWLQLRPQTLTDRYFNINRRAKERIKLQLGDAAAKHNISQEIVFGSQKRCLPNSASDPHCYAVPPSSLPEDIYGPQTDAYKDDKSDAVDLGSAADGKYRFNRPRYLNAGVAVGTVEAMRKLFVQADSVARLEKKTASYQYVFSRIFGEQELYREVVRRDSISAGQQQKNNWFGQRDKTSFNEQHLNEVRDKVLARNGSGLDFGIGLDYRAGIGLSTATANADHEWLLFADKDQIAKAQSDRGIGKHSWRSGRLPEDITNTPPPFWTFSREPLDRWRKWGEVPLYTDLWTGITPAIIHSGDPHDTWKSTSNECWPKMWFRNQSRILFDTHIYAPITPVAVGGYYEQTRREYWPLEIWKGGARDGAAVLGSTEGWIRFDEVCWEHHEELFGDGRGPWILPDNH